MRKDDCNTYRKTRFGENGMIVDKSHFKEFEIDLTGTCNLSCPLCTRNYLHASHTVYKKIRELKDIITQLDEYPNLSECFLAGQVSEPTLYPEFLEFLRYLKSRNIWVRLFSNGSTKNEEFWKEVAHILSDSDEMHFTICGSTQELHSKYRVGSDLNKILKNAEAYRSVKKNDYCQFIRFIYNKDDEINVKKLNFSNHYTVNSEGNRLFNEKQNESSLDIRPIQSRDKLIQRVLSFRPEKVEIKCKWLNQKKIYFDQSGNVYPCYMHCEYKDGNMNKSFDYSNIINFKYNKCILCDVTVRKKINQLNLDFLC